MLTLNKNQMRLPVGGHHFIENGVTIKGETFDEVVKRVREFRIANNITVANPEQEVLLFYAKNWPWMVKGIPEAYQENEPVAYRQWRDWAQRLWNRPPDKVVTNKEAIERQSICEKCQFNSVNKWTGSKSEVSAINRRMFILRRGEHVNQGVGFCSLHKWDNSVSTFLEQAEKFSAKEKDSTKPEACWVK